MCKKNITRHSHNYISKSNSFALIKCQKCKHSIPVLNLKRIFSSVLIAAYYACQSSLVYAQIEAFQNAPSGHKPILDAANNGVPVVHIAPPSNSGISHNQYENFNVNNNGAILNNSNQDVQSQLAGWIAANPQLGQNAATVILNEVMSTNPSLLSGTIEVAGRLADVIIANPNGITCDGCGFINTGRASLVVGRPEFSHDGLLESFQTLNGQLIIGGRGLNVTNIQQLDLIAKSMTVSGEVWANKLNAVLGTNKVNYKSLSTSSAAGKGSANGFALDIKAMGGMHAKQMYIVATDKGLGVNSEGRISSLEGDLVLKANGDIKLKDISTKNNLDIVTSGNVSLSGKLISENNLNIKSEQKIENEGIAYSKGLVNIESLNLLNTGEILQENAGSLNLSIKDTSENKGLVSSKGDIALSSKTINDSNGKYEALNDIYIKADNAFLNSNRLVSKNINIETNNLQSDNTKLTTSVDLNINSNNFEIRNNSKLISGNSLNIVSKSLSNILSEIVAQNELNINVSSKLMNNQGRIISENNLNINSDGLSNSEGLISTKNANLNINNKDLDNQSGKIIIQNGLKLNAANINNTYGEILSDNNINIDTNGNNFNNYSGIVQSGGSLSISSQGADINNTAGKILAKEQSKLTAQNFINNVGELKSEDVQINASIKNNLGAINASRDINIIGGFIDNKYGKIISNNNININAENNFINNEFGNILTNGSALLSASNLNNTNGIVSANNKLSVDAYFLNNSKGKIFANNGDVLVNLKNGELYNLLGEISGNKSVDIVSLELNNNSGKIFASYVNIDTQNTNLNNTHGEILAESELVINSGHLQNKKGKINSGENLSINTKENDLINNDGSISAKNNINISTNILNNNHGNISSKNNANINAVLVDNNKGEIVVNNIAEIKSDTLINSGTIQVLNDLSLINKNFNNSSGTLITGHDLNITSGSINNLDGKINSGSNLNINANSLDNTGGEVKAKNLIVDLENNGKLFNEKGEIFADDYLKLKVELAGNDGGKITSNGDMSLDFQGTKFNNLGGAIQSGKSMQILSADIDNSKGKIKSGGNLDIVSANIINNEGELNAKNNLKINALSIHNILGKLLANSQTINLRENGFLNNETGEIFAEKNIYLQTREVNNYLGNIKASEDLELVSTKNINNISGEILGNKLVNLITNDIENSKGYIASEVLTIQAKDINNFEGNILASGSAHIQAGDVENKSGKIHGQEVTVTLTPGSSLSNSSGEVLAEKNLKMTGGLARNDQGLVSAQGQAEIKTQGEVFQNDGGKVQAVGSLNIASADFSNKAGEVVSNSQIDIHSKKLNNETGKIFSHKEIKVTSQELNNKSGEMVVQNKAAPVEGHITVQTQGQQLNNEQGKMLASGNAHIQARDVENKSGKIHGQEVTVTLTPGSSLSNSSGEVLAEKNLTFTGGVARNDQGLVSAQGQAEIKTQGEVFQNDGGKVQAVGSLNIASADFSNKAGEVVSNSQIDIHSKKLNNETGKIFSHKEIKVTSQELNNTLGEMVVQNKAAPVEGHITVQTQGQQLNNEQGKILASGNTHLQAGNVENKSGKIHGQEVTVTLTPGSSLSNSAGEVLAEKNLTFTGGVARNDQGLVSAQGQAEIKTQGEVFQNDSGKVQAVGSLSIASADFSNKLGEVVSHEQIDIHSKKLNNETGKIFSHKEIKVTSQELNNTLGEMVVQNKAAPVEGHITVQTQGQQLNNEQGKILASGNTHLQAGNVENKSGKIHGQEVTITLTPGRSLSNSSGEVLAEKNLKMTGGLARNDQGLVSAQGQAEIKTQGEVFQNDSGKVQAVGSLSIASADFSNKLGEVVSHEQIDIHSKKLNNETGKIFSHKEIKVTSQELNNTLGEMVVQNKAAPVEGHITVQTQGQQLNNEQGKILASGNTHLQAGSVENKSGKIHGQEVTVTLTPGSSLSNSAGEVLAEKNLKVTGGVARNDQGLLSAQGQAEIKTQGEVFQNDNGKVQAVGALSIASADLSNKLGEVVSNAQIDIHSKKLNNETGKIFSHKEIKVTSQELNNTLGEMVVQNKAAPVEGHITVQTQGQQLNNEQGKILASGNTHIQARDVENKSGKIHGQEVTITLTPGSSLSNSSGEVLAEKNLKVTGGVARNDQGLLSAQGQAEIKTQGEVFQNDNGKVQALGALSIASADLSNKLGEVVSNAQIDIHSKKLNNETGKIFSHKEIKVTSQELNNKLGEMVVQNKAAPVEGHITVQTQGQQLNNEQGKILASGNTHLQAGSVENKSGKIHGQEVTITLTPGSSLSNSAGEVLAEKNLKMTGGLARNDQGLVSAQGQAEIKTQGAAFQNDNGKVQAVGALSIASADFSNKLGEVVSHEQIDIHSKKLNNETGKIFSHKEIKVTSQELNNKLGEMVVQNKAVPVEGHISVQTQGQQLNNEQGKILASGNTHLQAGSVENKSGKIHGQDVTITLTPGSSLSNSSGEVLAEKNLKMIGGLARNDQGLVSAQGQAEIKTQGQLLNNDQGRIQTQQDLYIDSAKLTNNKGHIAAQKNIEVGSQNLENIFGHIFAKENITTKTDNINNTNGHINGQSLNLILASSSCLNNNSGKVIAEKDMSITGGLASNVKGEILANLNLKLNSQGLVVNNDQGSIKSNENIDIQSALLSNKQGTVQSNKNLTVQSADLFNDKGKLFSQEKIDVQAKALFNNDGYIVGQKINIETQSGEKLENKKGKVHAQNDINIQSHDLHNENGSIIAGEKLNLKTANIFNREGYIAGLAGMQVNSQKIDNTEGLILTKKAQALLEINTNSKDIINKSGLIAASGEQKIQSSAIQNESGRIFGQNLTIHLSQGSHISNDKGHVIAKNNLDFKAGVKSNQGGLIASQGSINLDTKGLELNNAQGTIQANEQFKIKAENINNSQGTIAAVGPLTIDSKTLVNNNGQIFTNGNSNLDINTNQQSLSNEYGKISAAANLQINAKELISKGGYVSGQNVALNLQNGQIVNDNGKVIAEDKLQIDSGNIANNSGIIGSNNVLKVNTNNQNFVNKNGKVQAKSAELKTADFHNENGILVAAHKLTVNSNTFHNNNGSIVVQNSSNSSQNSFELNTNGREFINTRGKVFANALTNILNTSTITNNNGYLFAHDLNLKVNKIENNQGIIFTNNNLKLEASELNNQNGNIVSDSQLTANIAQSIQNQQGKINAKGILKIDTSNLNNSNGQIASLNNLTIKASQIDNAAGTLHGSQHSNIEANSTNNNNGHIYSSGSLVLNSPTLQNENGQIGTTQNLDITTSSASLGGKIVSQGNMLLNISSSYTNTTDLAAGGNLTLATGSFTNNNKIQANGNLDIQASGAAHNSEGAIIAAQSAGLTTQSKFTNLGKFDGETVKISASSLENKAQILGNNLDITADNILNHEAGKIVGASASGNMKIGGGSLTNEKGGEIISAGNISFNLDNLINISTKIYANGNINFNSTSVVNKKEKYETEYRVVPYNYSPHKKELEFEKGDILGHKSREKITHHKTTYGEEIKVDSPAGEIKAGGGMSFAGNVLNDKSIIMAAGTITYNDASTTNASYIIERQYSEYGNYFDVYRKEISFSDSMWGGFQTRHEIRTDDKVKFNIKYSDNAKEKHTLTEAILVANKAVGTLAQVQNINLSATKNIVPSINISAQRKSSGLSLSVFPKATINAPAIQNPSHYNEQGLQNAQKNNQTFAGNNLAQQQMSNQSYPPFSLNKHTHVQQGDIHLISGSVVQIGTIQLVNSEKPVVDWQLNRYIDDKGTTLNYKHNTQNSITNAQFKEALSLEQQLLQNAAAVNVNAVENETLSFSAFNNSNSYDVPAQTEKFTLPLNKNLLKYNAVSPYFGPALLEQNYTANIFNYFAASKDKTQHNYDLNFTPVGQYDAASGNLPGFNYRTETDPNYTDYNNFYASDYYVNQLKMQPERQLKYSGENQNGRLAEADDNLSLTGQTFLANYQATQEQFKQIVGTGKQFTQSYQISPGTNLSAESMKQLTASVITSVDDKTGKLEKHLRNLANGELKKNGGFIAFAEMKLKVAGDLKNEGTFVNELGKVEAENITNDGGQLLGNNTLFHARKDFKNLGGDLLSDKENGNLFVKAGNKIFMETKAVDIDYNIGGVKQKLTKVGSVSSISGHNVTLQSDGDIEKIGNQINVIGNLNQSAKGNIVSKSTVLETDIHANTMNGGFLKEKSITNFVGTEKAGGDNIIVAEKNINYEGVNVEAGKTFVAKGKNVEFKAAVDQLSNEYNSSVRNSKIYNSSSQEHAVGGKITTNGNILMQATGQKLATVNEKGEPLYKDGTGNINLTGVYLNSKTGNVVLSANNDVNILGQVLNHKFASWSQQTSEGIVNSSTTAAQSAQSGQTVEKSLISANNVLIKAGNKEKKQGNVNIIGAQIAATQDIDILASNDVNILSQELKSESSADSKTTTSGLFGKSLTSFTIGQKEEKQKNVNKSTQHVGSFIGTTGGNINIDAGGKYHQKASTVFSEKGDISVEADKIKIEHAMNIADGSSVREINVTGMNIGARNELFSLGQSLHQNYENSQKTNDSRMQALAAAASGMSLLNAAAPLMSKDPKTAKDPKDLASLKVTSGLGGSAQKNSTHYHSEEVVASTMKAGGNISLKAHGSGKNSNIEIYGSDILADNKLKLDAEGDIIARAAQSIQRSSSDAQSMSWEMSVALNMSTENVGLAGEVTGSLSKSASGKTDIIHRNAHLVGAKDVEINSGGSTTLAGASVHGNKVKTDIKGDLRIESLQDLSTYWSESRSGTVTGTACYPPVCAGNSGVSFQYSQTLMNSHYQSVGEQSGIFAGPDGYQVKVGGNTHLKGGVISSDAEAVKNKKNSFETGTFTQEDIVNKAWYEASQFSVSGFVGTGGGYMTPPIPLNKSDSKSNTTRSGVSEGSFIIRDNEKQKELTGKSAEETIATTNRNTADSHKKLEGIFNEEKINAEFAIVNSFNNELGTFIKNQASKQDSYKQELEGLLAKGADPNSAEVKEAASNLESAEKWGPGGAYRQIAQAISLAVSGNVGGSNIELMQGFAANYLQSLGAEKVKELAKYVGGEGSPAHIALHTLLGCAAGSIKGTCEQTAVGSAASVVVNQLLKEDKELSAEEKEKKINLTTALIGSVAAALGEQNVAAVTSGAQVESENNSLKNFDRVSFAVSLVDAARIKMAKMQSDNLKQDLEKHIGEYATVGDYVFNSQTFESELLMLSEGKKSFAEFLETYGKSAVLEIILNKSLSRLTELKPELKSILQPALLNVQKKGEDWLLNEGLSKQDQNKLTEKYEDTYKILSGKTSLKELERTKGGSYLLEIGSELNKKGIRLDKKGGTDWRLVRIDSQTQKEKVLDINLVNDRQEGYQSSIESKYLKEIIEGKTSWQELENKKGKEFVEKLVKSQEAENYWKNEFVNPNINIKGDKEDQILKKWDEGKNYLVEKDPQLKDKPSILGNKAPYSSREVAEDMKDRHGKDNVSSTTVPPLNKPNVKMAGKEKVIQVDVQKQEWDVNKKQYITVTEKQEVRIVFDKKGYPIFDDVAKVEVRISPEKFRKMNDREQMIASTKELKRMIENNEIPRSSFTEEQLKDIFANKPNFKGLTWHHHQDTGRMQLVPRKIHEEVDHIGWRGMNKGDSNEK